MFVYETQYDKIAMVQLYYAISSVLSESQGIWKKLEQNKLEWILICLMLKVQILVVKSQRMLLWVFAKADCPSCVRLNTQTVNVEG